MTREHIQRVRLYLREDDKLNNQPLYVALLEEIQREGATGATVLRGAAGFGPGKRLLTPEGGLNDNPPLVLEWVDPAERINRLLPTLHEMAPRALITLEEVHIYHALLHAQGPFTVEQNAGSIMHHAPQTLPVHAPLGEVLLTMLTHHQSTIPIVDEQQRILGIITEQEINQRTGFKLPLRFLPLLTETESKRVLAPFVGQSIHETMNTEPRTVSMGTSLPETLRIIIEWNYEEVPVTGRDGQLVGLVAANDILHTAVAEQATGAQSGIQDAGPPTPVQLMMQYAVPFVRFDQPLSTSLPRLLRSSNHYVVVADEPGHVHGSLTSEHLLRVLKPSQRLIWLEMMLGERGSNAAALEGWTEMTAQVMQSDLVQLRPTTSILEAVQTMMSTQIECAPVVNEEGIAIGLVQRSGLLRALLHESQ